MPSENSIKVSCGLASINAFYLFQLLTFRTKLHSRPKHEGVHNLDKSVIEQLINPQVREEFYYFIAHYVRKVFPDSEIVQYLRLSVGSSFLDMISTSDIAYVLSTIVKNGKDG
jgi:hypothetical protein